MACKTINNVHSTLLEKGLIDSKFNITGNTQDVFPYIDFLNQYGKEKYGVKEDLISTKTIPARLGKSATVKVFYNQEVGQQIDKIKDNPDLYSSKFNTKENEVQATMKIVSVLNNFKRNKFEKSKKQGWINDLLKAGVSQQQIELFNQVAKDGMSKEDIALELVSNYNYTVEINTAKEESQNYDMIDTTGEGDFEPVEFIPDTELILEEDEDGNIIGTKEVLSEKGKKQIEDRENKRKNTQHYSNLTVPGGTNYTENEIATPLITPSIKGHAQFATDNGIGWFRSDDKIIPITNENQVAPKSLKIVDNEDGSYYITSNIGILGDGISYLQAQEDLAFYIERATEDFENNKTKTRRILELQSDLFQKGRDKKDLIGQDVEKNIREQYGEEYVSQITDEYRAKNDKSKTSENQFLQLLNKDNNWVTFFIKSIIQDSAKKGYEKVLFPLGDTAAKIEGHQTLEEFKKQKEDRIKELEEPLKEGILDTHNEFLDIKYIKVNNKWYQEVEGDINYNKEYNESELFKNELREINQLKQELERVEGPEGFGALKPIYNFYENTVANILKKQYKGQVKSFTDEYGNKWNEIEITPEDRENFLFNSKFSAEDLNNGTNEDVFLNESDESLFGNEEIPLGDNYGEFLKYKLEVLSKKEHEASLLRSKLSSATPSFKVKLLKEIKGIEKDINFIQEQISKLEKYEAEYMFHAIKEDLEQIEQIFKSKDNSNNLEIKKKLEFYDTFLVGKNSEYSAESLQDYVEFTKEFNALVAKAKMLSDKYPEYMSSVTIEHLQEEELMQEVMKNSGKSINELITSTQDITSFDSYLMGLSNTAFSSDNILPQYLQIQMHKALINHTNVSSKLIDILNQVEKETGLYNPDWIYNRDKNGNKDNTIIDSYTDTWFNATKTFRTLIYQYQKSNVKNKNAAHLAVTQWLKDNTFMIDFSKIPKIREMYMNNSKYSKYFDSNFTDEQAEAWENEMKKQYGFRYDELIDNLILSLERFENISNDTTYSEIYKNRYNVWEVLQNIKNGVSNYHHIKLGDNKISFYSDFYSLPFLPKEASERKQIINELGQKVPPPDFYNKEFRNTVLNNANNAKYYNAVRNIVKYNNDTYSTNTYTNGRYSFPRVRKEMLQSLGDSLKEIRSGNFKELYNVGKETLNNWQAMFYEKGFSHETEGKVNSNYRDTYKKEVKEREQGYIIQGLSKEDAYKKAIAETDKNYSEDFSRDIKAISQMASLHNARIEMAPMAESVVEAYKHFNPEMKNGLGRLEYYVNHIVYNRTGKYRNTGKWEGEKINPKIQHFLDIINGVSKGKLAKYKGKLLSDSEKELFSMYRDVIEKGIIPKEISINERIGDTHFKLSKTEKLHTIQGEVATEQEWNREFENFIKAKVENMGLDLNVAGLVDGILKTVIYKALAINPISGIFNRNEGLNSAYIMDATGLYWTPDNLQSAKEMMAFYNSRKIWSKHKKNAPIRKGAKQMAIFEQLIKRMPSVLQDRKDELQRNVNENKFSLEDMDVFWLAVQSAESKNQGSIMLAMMMDYKLKDSNGNEIPMIDKHTKEFTAFDLDSKGHIVAKPGFEQYLDNITSFEDLIINMSVAISRSQGNYSQNDIMRAKGAIWGKVATNMITWLPEHLAQRWGTSKQVDLYRKGKVTQGRYVAAAQGNTINTGVMIGLGGLGISYGMLGMAGLMGGGIISAIVATKYLAKIASTNTVKRDANYIKEFTQMLLSLGIEYLNYPSHLLSSIPGMRKLKFFKNVNPLSNNTMTEEQQNSMRAMTRELAIMLFWLSVKMAIMALYKGIGGEDDDEKSDRRMRYYFLQNQLSRSITTLESFMNPYAFVKDNARNTFLSELTDIFKLAHSVLTFDWDGIKDNSTAPIPIPSMVDKTVRNLVGNRENSIIQDKIDYSSMVDFNKIPSPLHWTSTLAKDFFTDGEYSKKKEYREAREKVREKIKEEVMEEYGEDKDLVKTITDLRVKELIGNKYQDLSYEDAIESIESGEIMEDPKIKKKSTKQSRLKSLEKSLENQGITPKEVQKIISKESNR